MSEPAGVICLFESETCPAGWSKYTDMNDDGTGIHWYVGASPDLTVSGSNTHTHSDLSTHTHNINADRTGFFEDNYGADYITPEDVYDLYAEHHLHNIKGVTSDSSSASVQSANHSPPRARFVLCKMD